MRKFAEFMVKARVIMCLLVLVLTVVSGVFITKLNINSDMTSYLPDSSQMKKGMDIMTKEFGGMPESQTIRVLFKDLPDKEKEEVAAGLGELKYVASVSYDKESKEFNKDNYTLYKIDTEYAYNSKEEVSIRRAVTNKYKDYDIMVKNGAGAEEKLSIGAIVAALVVMLAIVFLICKSWIEPIYVILAAIVAIVMNVGTNAFTGACSQVTLIVAVVMQLILVMCASISLMNRYRHEKNFTDDKIEAMTVALRHILSSITSSTFIIVASLVTLLLMSFTLGQDFVIVLTKGMVCSWFCIITLLPCILVGTDRVIEATTKKIYFIPSDILGNMSYALRYVMPVCLLLVFGAGYLLQNNTEAEFSASAQDEISKIIPNTNSIVAFYNNDEADKVESVVKEIEKDSEVVNIMSYPTTLGKESNSEEMSEMLKSYMSGSDMSLDASLLNLLYYDYYKKGELPSMTLSEFINFLADDVATNETFASQLDESMVEQIDQLKQFADEKTLKEELSVGELAEFFGMDAATLKQLFVLYYSKNGGIDTGSMTLQQFVEFLTKDVMTNKTYSSLFDDSVKQQINQLKTYVNKEKMTTKMTYEEAAKMLGMDGETVKLLYIYYYSKSADYLPANMSLNTFVDFMLNNVAKNKMFASYFDKNTMSQIQMMGTYANKKFVTKKMYSKDMAALLGMEKETIDLIYVYYFGSKNNGANAKLTLPVFTNFLVNKVITNKMLGGNFDSETRALLVTMNQLVNVAAMKQQLNAQQISQMLGIDQAMITPMMALMGKEKATLSELVGFLTTTILPNEAYAALIPVELRGTILQMSQIIQLVENKTALGAGEIAMMLGMEDVSQVEQLFVLYTGMNTSKKAMSPQEMVNYLLQAKKEGGAIASAISDDVVKQLQLLQSIINLAVSGKELTYKELATMLGIDESMMKMLYTLKDSYGDTSKWKLSMQTIVDFILDNTSMFGSMLDKSTTETLTLAKTLITSAVNETEYTAADISALLGMEEAQLTQLFTLYSSQYGDTSEWKMSISTLIDYLISDVLTNKSFAGMFDDKTKSLLTTMDTLVDAILENKEYTAEELTGMIGSLAEGLDKSIVELLYLLYGSTYNSEKSWTMSVDTLMNHLATDIVNDEKFSSFIPEDLKGSIGDLQTQLSDGKKQLMGNNYSILLVDTLYPDNADIFIEKFDKVLDGKLSKDYYIVGNSVFNYEMGQTFKKEILYITLLMMAAIFIILLAMYRSIAAPVVLALASGGAVFMTIGASSLSGSPLLFVAFIVVQCIVMAITVDQGILFTNYYIEGRLEYDVKDALKYAYSAATPSTLVGGLVLALFTGIVGLYSGMTSMAPMCISLAIGAIVSLVLIVFIIPGCVAASDKLLVRHKKTEENYDYTYQE